MRSSSCLAVVRRSFLVGASVVAAAGAFAAPLGAQDVASAVSGVRAIDVAVVADSAAVTDSAATQDGRTQKTFFVKRDIAYTAAAVLVSAGVSAFDKRIAHWSQSAGVQGDSSRHDLVRTLTRINETPLTIAAFATWGVGRLAGSATTADVGLHTFEALVLTTGVSEVIRGTLGRTRPRSAPGDPFDFQPGSGFTKFETRSFPSLHTAASFATATALVGELEERRPGAVRWAAPLIYTAAAVPGLTRVYLDQHWASDIAAGAFLGALIGSRVVHYAHSHERTKLDRTLLGVSAAPDGHGGVMVVVNARR